MSEDKHLIRVTSDMRKTTGWVSGTVDGSIKFEAKVFDTPSKFGIDDGRISKLSIRSGNEEFVNYDRGWDIEPSTPEHRKIYEAVVSTLNDLDMVHNRDSSSQGRLHDKLEAAKEKTALKEFEVTITETLQMKVTVEARNQSEAEGMVEEGWIGNEYLLDADHFKGAKFEAALVKRELPGRGEER